MKFNFELKKKNIEVFVKTQIKRTLRLNEKSTREKTIIKETKLLNDKKNNSFKSFFNSEKRTEIMNK